MKRACPGLDLELFGAVFHGAFAERCEAVFRVFDRLPANGKVDAHEVFACCIICSSAFTGARIRILFELYDLNGSNDLTADELVIMLRSILRALCKLTGGTEPALDVLEAVSEQLCSAPAASEPGSEPAAERRVSFAEWLAFCRREPVVKKMLDMFDAPKLKRSRRIRAACTASLAGRRTAGRGRR